MVNPDTIVFDSSIVRIGAFRLPSTHPSFDDTGPVQNHCFVFPRHACWIEHQGQKPFVADSTRVPLYNSGQLYRRGLIDPAGDASDWFGIVPAVLRDMVACFDPASADHPDRPLARTAVDAPPGLFLHQRRIFNHATAEAGADAFYVEEAVLDMFGAVLEAAYRNGRAPVHELDEATIVARTRAHLGRTFLARESVADLAAAVRVSTFHLCKVFRRATGRTLHQYRTDLRLRWSLQPLADGVDILTTALDAGFAHHSHFTMAFRRAFGMTPSAFRRAQRRFAGVTPLEMMKTRPE